MSANEKRLFWTTLYGGAIAWAALLVGAIASFELNYALIPLVALCLAMTNLVGYFKCSKDAQSQLNGFARRQVASALFSGVGSLGLVDRGFRSCRYFRSSNARDSRDSRVRLEPHDVLILAESVVAPREIQPVIDIPNRCGIIRRRVVTRSRRRRDLRLFRSRRAMSRAAGASAPSTASSHVAFSGWLTKRGGKDLYGKATWRLRYFVLRRPRHAKERACVRYFANEPADGAESAAKGEFAINGQSAVRILDSDETFAEFGLKAHKYAGKRMFAFQTMPGQGGKSAALVVEAEGSDDDATVGDGD